MDGPRAGGFHPGDERQKSGLFGVGQTQRGIAERVEVFAPRNVMPGFMQYGELEAVAVKRSQKRKIAGRLFADPRIMSAEKHASAARQSVTGGSNQAGESAANAGFNIQSGHSAVAEAFHHRAGGEFPGLQRFGFASPIRRRSIAFFERVGGSEGLRPRIIRGLRVFRRIDIRRRSRKPGKQGAPRRGAFLEHMTDIRQRAGRIFRHLLLRQQPEVSGLFRIRLGAMGFLRRNIQTFHQGFQAVIGFGGPGDTRQKQRIENRIFA